MSIKPKIWLSSPHMGSAEQKFVEEAFDTNWIAPLGPNVDGFEKDLENYTGVAHAAALSSGTAAIHLALIQSGVKAGDIVFCQSMTFSATANPIAYLGAHPVFIDSEKDSWNMNPYFLEEAIKDQLTKNPPEKLKAILPVHLYGIPTNMIEIMKIAAKYKLRVIEDAAEALGSSFQNKKCGSFGDFGILSFNGNKIITTSGGGALISNNEEAIRKTRFLATQARDEAPHYQHSEIGYNYRMSNVLAGIGRGQMMVLDDRVKARRANFTRYEKYFNGISAKGYQVQFQPEIEGSFSNRWLTAIYLNPEENKGITRETIRLALEKENIESRPLWKPMHLQPVFKNAVFYGDGTSEELFNNGLCLPSGSNLTDEDFDRIFGVLDNLFKK